MVRKFVEMKQPEAAVRVARVLDEKAGPKGSCLLAESLVPLGKLDNAAALLEKAAKAGDPATAGATALNLATAENADTRWLPLADRFLAAALETQPKSVELLQKQAIVRHFQGDFKGEVLLYHDIVKLDPPSFEFLNNMAWTYSEDLNRPDLGLEWVDEAIKKCGDQGHIRDTRGVILTRLGKFDAAIKDLESAVRDLPSGSTYYHLARALIKAKRTGEARKWQALAKKSGLTRSQLQPTELTDWDIVMTP
jgi:tetratricopeptide (TPR) repeat protein